MRYLGEVLKCGSWKITIATITVIIFRSHEQGIDLLQKSSGAAGMNSFRTRDDEAIADAFGMGLPSTH